MSVTGDGRATPTLARWRARADRPRQIVCLGDSITQGAGTAGVARGWVDQLAVALDEATGPRPGDGFRPLWRGQEWSWSGTWTRTAPTDAFDVAPFGRGYYSSGRIDDVATWTKPAAMKVAAFDVYSFAMPGAGELQLRVDGGSWFDAPAPEERGRRLHKLRVDEAVTASLAIRGHDAVAPRIAPLAGMAAYASERPPATGTTVHNLGLGQAALEMARGGRCGDRLALLDDLRPDLVTVLFSNDVIFDDPGAFGDRLRGLVDRVDGYADVFVINPFEQRPSPEVVYEGDFRIGRREVTMQAEYRAVTARVAREAGCALIDLYDAWAAVVGEGWERARASGLMADDLHPTQAGHDDIAARVRSVLGC